MIVLPGSDLLGLSLSLLAILILRVAALYDKTKWVGRCLWILAGLLNITTIALVVITVKSFYSECMFAGVGKYCLQRIRRRICVRAIV